MTAKQQTTIAENGERLMDLINKDGLTLSEAAAKLEMSPDDARAHLAALELPRSRLDALESAGLGLEHALALIRIPDSRLRDAALVEMCYLHVPANEAGRYVDAILPPALPAGVGRFLTGLDRELERLRDSGTEAEVLREDADNVIKIALRLPIT